MLPTIKRFERHGLAVSTRDVLKAVAALSMVIDHLGWLFLDDDPYLRLLGRVAAPVYFFLVGHASRYPIAAGLFIYGAIITGFYSFEVQRFTLDILIVFLFVRVFLSYAPAWLWRGLPLLALFVACALLHRHFAVISYGTLGLLWAVCGYLRKNRNWNLYWWVPASMLFSVWQLMAWVDPPQTLVFDAGYLLLFGALGFVMCVFRIRSLAVPGFLKLPVLYLSRFSLEIYAVHLTLFIVLAWCLRWQGLL